MRWVVLVFGLEFPALLALIDCSLRADDHFAGGADDKRAWQRWLVVAVATAWLAVGYGIVLGYFYSVVKRNAPGRP